MDEQQMKSNAKEGLKLISEAILELLKAREEGLSNSEIARLLNLECSHEGGQKNYLTYSVLGILMAQNKVVKTHISERSVIYTAKKD